MLLMDGRLNKTDSDARPFGMIRRPLDGIYWNWEVRRSGQVAWFISFAQFLKS